MTIGNAINDRQLESLDVQPSNVRRKVAIQKTDGTEVSIDSDGHLQVDVVAALPTGTNVIGAVKQDVNNWTAIGPKYATAANTTETTVWEPAAGKKFVITDLLVSQGVAAGTVTLRDGAAGTTVALFALAINGGAAYQFKTPIVSGTADNHFTFQNSAGTTYVTALGYEI